MKRISTLLICALALHLYAGNIAGTLVLNGWAPAKSTTGPQIRTSTIKWNLSDLDKNGITTSLNMQWYLGENYQYQNQYFPLQRIGAVSSQLSISNMVVKAVVQDGKGRNLGYTLLDMGATPPHGGNWGNEVRRVVSWENFMPGITGDSCRKLFAMGITLSNPEIFQIQFGGTWEIDKRCEQIRMEDKFNGLMMQAEQAFNAKDFLNAERLFLEARNLNPNDPNVNARLIQSSYAFRMQQGDAAFLDRKYDIAIVKYQEALQFAPNDPQAKIKIEDAKTMIVKAEAYNKLVNDLRLRYANELKDAGTKQNAAWFNSCKSFEASVEACNLEEIKYWTCYIKWAEAKEKAAADEAAWTIYGDQAAKQRANIPFNCAKPNCNNLDNPEAVKNASADQLYTAAVRKMENPNVDKNETSRGAAEDFLDEALKKNPQHAPSLAYRANFSTDIIEKMMFVNEALYYDEKNAEARAILNKLQPDFNIQLFEKITMGIESFVKRATDAGLIEGQTYQNKNAFQYAIEHDKANVLDIMLGGKYYSAPNVQELLFLAAEKNKANSAKVLLQRGAKADTPNLNGETPLTIATRNGSREVLNALTSGGMSQSSLGSSLRIAVEARDVATARTLIEKGSEVENVNSSGDNLLMTALQLRDETMANLLLKSNANVNYRNYKGESPLYIAANNRMNKQITALLAQNADAEKALKFAQTANPALTRYLGEKVIAFGMNQNRINLVQTGLQYYPTAATATNEGGEAFILQALREQKFDFFQLFLESQNNFNERIDGKYLLLECVSQNRPRFLNELMETGKSTLWVKDESRNTALHLAAAMGSVEMCNTLLRFRHPLEDKDNQGRTPLLSALDHDKAQTALMLIDADADINAMDEDTNRAIHLASAARMLEVVKTLVQQGASVNEPGQSTMRPLHYAAQNGDDALVDYLVSKGASKTAVDAFGRTPAKVAKQNKFKALAKKLKV